MSIENNKELEDFYRSCSIEWYPLECSPTYQKCMENIEETLDGIKKKILRPYDISDEDEAEV